MKILLGLLLPFLALAIVPREGYQNCLKATNKLESPADRDAEKIECYNSDRAKKSVDRCVGLAKVLEHTSTSDLLLLSCVSENLSKMNVSECVNVAKKLYYAENRDRAIWICVENKPMKDSKCREVTNEMTYPHTKSVALNFCNSRN